MRRTLALLVALALPGCGGGGSGTPSPAPTPAPSPTPSPGASPYSLAYSTLLDGASGASYEMARDIAVDTQGNIYVTGGTTAADFPTTTGAYDTVFGTLGLPADAVGSQGPSDVFVTKMSPNGQILWSTYLGGPNYDRAYAIRVGSDGSVYVAGRAGPGFPTTTGVVQRTFAGDNTNTPSYGQQDGFVAKISADGSRLLWSTYVGDAGTAFLRDMDVDGQGRVYLAAVSISQPMSAFITNGAWQGARADNNDGAYIRLSSDARRVEYGTYFGASGSAAGRATGAASIRVGGDGSVVVSSVETGTDFPATAGAYQRTSAGGADFIVMKFTSSDQIAFATYVGGTRDELNETHHLALDQAGRIYLSGATQSTNYPVTSGAFQRQSGGGNDAVLSILSANGSQLVASTYLGGNRDEMVQGVNVAHRGGTADAIVLSGNTRSTNFTANSGAPQTSNRGGYDAFVAVLAPDVSALRFFTYLGGAGEDDGRASAISPDGSRIHVCGHTLSSNFPTTSGALDRTLDGAYGAWVSVFAAN